MGPVLLNLLVNFMETREEPLSWGVIYSAGLFFSGILGALLQNQYIHQINKVMLAVKTAVLTTVYRKAIHGEGTGLAGFSAGEVMNLMSTDADRISNFYRSLHELWSLPLQFSITLYLLYQQVGIAFLGGLGLAFLLVPLNKVLATRIMNNNKELLRHKDARVKVLPSLCVLTFLISLHSNVYSMLLPLSSLLLFSFLPSLPFSFYFTFFAFLSFFLFP